jgi:hypothetical protein
LAILDQTGLDDLDGILGLAPDIPSNGPSFIQNLKSFGFIEKKVVSFFIGHLNQKSKVMFGGIDYSLINSGQIEWFPLIGKSWWQIALSDTQYGTTSVFSGATRTCIMDTGTSLIAMPHYEF